MNALLSDLLLVLLLGLGLGGMIAMILRAGGVGPSKRRPF